jgi:hypothetical protein
MEEPLDPEMLALLELLLNQDALEYESDWDVLEALVSAPASKEPAQ